MSVPVFSIVIPAFNRLEPLKYTLRSVAAAARVFTGPVEVLLVDDGSEPPLASQLAGFDPQVAVHHLRQPNQGSIVARLTGLHAARGERILFLDSDDLIHPEKLVRHAAAATHDVDIVYDDMALARLEPDHGAAFEPLSRLPTTASVPELLLRIQPAPHNPSFRRDFLRRVLQQPIVPPSRRIDPVGDVWLYYNASVHAGTVAKLDAALTAVGPHDEARFSQHWERLGLAAWRLVREFHERCPRTAATEAARRIAGECAFNTWRRLPRGFPRVVTDSWLAWWQTAPRGPLDRLGGRGFVALSRLCGAAAAGRLLRWRNPRYAAVRTVSDAEITRLLAA